MKVYLITNSVNGKQYVGQTVKSVEKRWKQHLRDVKRGTLPHLYSAMKKYGIDKFFVQELCSVLTQEELNVAEVFYIIVLGTKSPNGYNLTEGGSTGAAHKGHRHSEGTKKFLRERFTGSGNANFGKHKSEHTKKLLSISNSTTKPWHHGTGTAYQKYKCRCTACTGENSWYGRMLKKRGYVPRRK